MPANYPGAIYPVPSFGTNMSDVETHTTWRDQMVLEMRAIQTELGTTPSGAFSTVKDRLAALAATFLTFQPAGSTDAPATLGTWIALGNVTVPTGATEAVISVAGSGLFCITGDADMELRLTLGGAGPVVGGMHRTDWLLSETTKRQSIPTLSARWSGLTPGASLALVIQSQRASGTGTIRADTVARFDAVARFTG